jgi:DNA (cytosine-5)-methyltransferase 1
MEQLDIFDLGVEYHYRPPLYFTRPVRLFEAFAGVGCQAMAFRRAKLPYVSVGISEIDKYAIKSYEAIHGKTNNYGDIKLMREIPPCDVFTWSFPCTDISKAGKRNGMTEETRSGLVYEVLRLLKATRQKPECLIMENVPDLIQEAFKAQFYEIQKEIESPGYKNFTLTLNAIDYGVAQNRDRVFMVSLLGDYHYEFPMPIALEKRLKDYLEPNVAEKYYLSEKMIRYFNDNSKANEEKGNGFRFTPKRTDDIANALALKSDRMGGNFVVDPICLNSKVNGKQPSLQDRIYSVGGTSTAITQAFMPSIAIPEATEGVVTQELRIRKLTPRECWRLMGIDDADFDKAKAAGVSNSQLYKQAGNGIVVDVFAAILKNLISQ